MVVFGIFGGKKPSGDVNIENILSEMSVREGKIIEREDMTYVKSINLDSDAKNIDAMVAELKKGNVAIAILLGAIIFAIANVVESGVSALTQNMTPNLSVMELLAALIIGIVNLFIGLVLAVFSIYVAISVLDKITVGIDEFRELRKGNVAVAIMMAAVLFAVSFVIRGAVAGMTAALSPQSVAAAFGWA